MRTMIQTEIMTFDELDEKAKDKARNWYMSGGLDDGFAWECLNDDAKTIGLKIKGLDQHRANKGEFIDGAFNCANAILSEHGPDCETYKTASKFIEDWKALPDPEDDDARADDADALEGDFLHDLLSDYELLWRKDCEYRQSSEYIDENILANEYTFTADGELA